MMTLLEQAGAQVVLVASEALAGGCGSGGTAPPRRPAVTMATVDIVRSSKSAGVVPVGDSQTRGGRALTKLSGSLPKGEANG